MTKHITWIKILKIYLLFQNHSTELSEITSFWRNLLDLDYKKTFITFNRHLIQEIFSRAIPYKTWLDSQNALITYQNNIGHNAIWKFCVALGVSLSSYNRKHFFFMNQKITLNSFASSPLMLQILLLLLSIKIVCVIHVLCLKSVN